VLIDVALPFRLPGMLTYRLPIGLASARPGCRIGVPLGTRQVIGCLIKENRSGPPKGLKEVRELLDSEPILTRTQLKLLEWASHYYLTPVGEVLRHLLPPPLLRKRRLKGRTPRPLPRSTEFSSPSVTLNREQQQVFEKILPGGSFLLKGITGSGKTEIYIRLAEEVLARGKQVLILVPEIALTPQLIGRFAGAIQTELLPYHSGLTEAQRLQVWQKVRNGEAPIVIGTRSSIFLPFNQLGLIVVDEEHDPSYKQEERFCYNARDLALWRGKEEEATVILGSATPSLESIHRARQGRLQLLELRSRPAGASLPEVRVIDRRMKGKEILSEELRQALAETLKRGEQGLLFLNRRGFAPCLVCRVCGFIPRCEACEIAFTYHKQRGVLLCHYCDRSTPVSSSCPSCRTGNLVPQGIGTEKVEEELKKLFPMARIARLDRDAGSGEKMLKILTRMQQREIDILVGTQTVTKGHDYPHLTLVGIVDADTSLNLPDFRAVERTCQLLTQVSGRSGRAALPGRVIIQTYCPDHPGILPP